MKPYHVSIAAEALVSSLFARCGFDVSVQYGANQPEYDLSVIKGESVIKVSVKGSKDGGWGLCQGYITKGQADYHAAIKKWLDGHSKNTIVALVQFQDIGIMEMPRVYLATPSEIAERLKATRAGHGDTILYENHTWGDRAVGKGTVEKIPDSWKFTKERVLNLMG